MPTFSSQPLVLLNQAGLASSPGVPASGTPVVNSNSFGVQVVITGGTMTQVLVGPAASLVQVGTGAGTYFVPAGQSIQLTYSVAPTWVWGVAGKWVDSGEVTASVSVQVEADSTVTAFSVQVQQSDDPAAGVSGAAPSGLNVGSAITTQGLSAPSAGPARWFRALLSGYTGTGSVRVLMEDIPQG